MATGCAPHLLTIWQALKGVQANWTLKRSIQIAWLVVVQHDLIIIVVVVVSPVKRSFPIRLNLPPILLSFFLRILSLGSHIQLFLVVQWNFGVPCRGTFTVYCFYCLTISTTTTCSLGVEFHFDVASSTEAHLTFNLRRHDVPPVREEYTKHRTMILS